jgi:predicted amidohydrolase YtcJ
MKSKIPPLVYLVFSIFSIYLSSCQQKTKVDLILYNARIYTVDSANTIVEAMAIKDKKIIALGTSKYILGHYNAQQSRDLHRLPVYPGFWDAHCHFYGYGLLKKRYADLVGTISFDEVIERIKDFRVQNPNELWILGRGWDQNDWKIQSMPNKSKLDSLFPNTPVLLVRIDGHSVIVNSAALQLAGFDTKTVIKGGELLVQNNELSGVLLDNAADSLKRLIPSPSDLMIEQSLITAEKDCFAVGLTSLKDAGLNYPIIQKIEKMQQQSKLKIQLDIMLEPSVENMRHYVGKGIYQSDRLRIQSVKLYADGALGSRGACLLEPYSDWPSNGFLIETPAYYDSICSLLYHAGFQVNTHAIGDSAVRLMLKTYAKYLQGTNDRRWRIEHAQCVNPADFHYFGDFNIIPAINTTHATSDMYWAKDRLGAQRIMSAYAFKMLLDQNGWCTNGSDFPIESVNPLFGFYAAVTRKDHNSKPLGGFQMGNALSREEALRAMTIWAAKGSFAENESGSLELNKNADFVILDKDIMQIPENEIFTCKVLETYLSAEPVFVRNEK